MALITCPECGRKISDKANACVGCGYPIKCNTQKLSGLEQYQQSKKLINDIKNIVNCTDINHRNDQFLSHISFPLGFYL